MRTDTASPLRLCIQSMRLVVRAEISYRPTSEIRGFNDGVVSWVMPTYGVKVGRPANISDEHSVYPEYRVSSSKMLVTTYRTTQQDNQCVRVSPKDDIWSIGR
jgi:hypothetical protein